MSVAGYGHVGDGVLKMNVIVKPESSLSQADADEFNKRVNSLSDSFVMDWVK